MSRILGGAGAAILAGGVGSILDPMVQAKSIAIAFIIVGAGGLGWVLGAIADGVNK